MQGLRCQLKEKNCEALIQIMKRRVKKIFSETQDQRRIRFDWSDQGRLVPSPRRLEWNNERLFHQSQQE